MFGNGLRVSGRWLLCATLAIGGCDCSDPDGDGSDASTRLDSDTTGRDGETPSDAPNLQDTMFDPDGPIQARDGGVEITEDGGFQWTCVPITCDGHNTECGDCEDNDGDGLVDSRDPECLGPCDNTEGPALTAGVGGEVGASCNRDCYFDFGNGHGEGDCRWDTTCDPLAPDHQCAYNEADLNSNRCPSPQADNCFARCRPLTPNGCDCFGCCTFDALDGRSEDDGGEFVWLGSGIGMGEDGEGTCTLEDIEDTELCKPCTPQMECFNDCGRCELCVGRDTIPDDCLNPPPPPVDAAVPDAEVPDGAIPDANTPDAGMYEPRCDDGIQPCGLEGDAECEEFHYCVTGCCQSILI